MHAVEISEYTRQLMEEFQTLYPRVSHMFAYVDTEGQDSILICLQGEHFAIGWDEMVMAIDIAHSYYPPNSLTERIG